jgi:hypothetical protein
MDAPQAPALDETRACAPVPSTRLLFVPSRRLQRRLGDVVEGALDAVERRRAALACAVIPVARSAAIPVRRTKNQGLLVSRDFAPLGC